ncbi:MAG: hypothetical protein K1X78_19530 [Verrucomicrobiaceae bacterium]|nr:hypothetical protein [Verrucomicrobiaceae bacterium]
MNAIDGSGGCVQAFISQTDVIPAGTRLIRLPADGALGVTLNGVAVPMTAPSLAVSMPVMCRHSQGPARNSRSFTPPPRRSSYSWLRVDDVSLSTLAAPESGGAIALVGGLVAACQNNWMIPSNSGTSTPLVYRARTGFALPAQHDL